MVDFIGFNADTPCVELQFTRFDGSQFRKVCYDTSEIDFWMKQYNTEEGIFKGTCSSVVRVQQELQQLKSEISEQLALIEKDKADEKETEYAKRFKQAWNCSYTA